MYQVTYGYLAKFTLHVSQVHFVKLQSSPCYHAIWLLCQVDFTFLPSSHSALSKLLPKIELPLVFFKKIHGLTTLPPPPFLLFLSLSFSFLLLFVLMALWSFKRAICVHFLEKSCYLRIFLGDMKVCLCGALWFPKFLIGHMVTCKNLLREVRSNVAKSIWSWKVFLLSIEKKT